MHPTLFEVGGIEFPAYLTFLMLGFLGTVWLARREAMDRSLDHITVVDVSILALCVGIVGARLLAVLTDGYLMDFVHLCTDPSVVDAVDTKVRVCQVDADCGFEYLCNLEARDAVLANERRSMCYPPRDCLAVLKFWQGGLTFYGGVLLALPAMAWLSNRRGMRPLLCFDLIAPNALVGLALGRIGCFMNGCCFGAETDSPLGVRFPGHFVDRHPAQLYETVACLLLFALLWVYRRRSKAYPGALTGATLLSYSIYRFGIEFVRDDTRGGLAGLSTSQLLSIPLVLLGVFLLRRGARNKPS